MGPRQVGKTTGLRQLLVRTSGNCHYANADDMLVTEHSWLLALWQQALLLGDGTLLVIDEIQKIPNWSEAIGSLVGQASTPLAGGAAGIEFTANSERTDGESGRSF